MNLDRFFRELESLFDRDASFEEMETLFNKFEHDLDEEMAVYFLHTFRKTIELCHCVEPEPVPDLLHQDLLAAIAHAPRGSAKPRAKKQPRKRKS